MKTDTLKHVAHGCSRNAMFGTARHTPEIFFSCMDTHSNRTSGISIALLWVT